MEQIMKKLLFTSIALLSLAAPLPASAQQANTAPQQSNASQQNGSGAVLNVTQDQIMQAQEALNQKGFDAGKADGILGPRTKRALSNFQKNQGLQRSGRLDDKTLAALGVSHGQQQSRPSTPGQRG